MIILLIPLGEGAEAGAEWGGGAEAEILFQRCCVSVSYRDIAGLHRNQLLVCLEVVIGWEHSGANQLLLEYLHEVEQVLGVVVADVVHLVGRNRQSVLAVLLFRCVLHHAHHAFHDVVNVGEIALAIAVVENLNLIALQQLVGEAEVSHIGTSSRSIDGEEAQSRRWNVVELRVGVGHQLVAFLGGSVERHRIVNLVVGRVRHLLVRAVNA